MVDVSVITPTRDAARHLQATIDSVRAQQAAGVTVEHLLVDDGSTDGTLTIARDNHVAVLPGRGAGLYDAMNVGAAAARGRVLNFLGGDDLLLPGAAATAAERLAGGGARWLVGGLEWIDDAARPLGYLGPPPRWMTVGMFAALGWNCLHHQSTFMSKELFDALGGYDPTFRIAGDYELLARALALEGFDAVRAPLACFRRPGTNLSATPATAGENERVAQRYGPSSAWRRYGYRALLRAWLNGRHPRWMLAKAFPSLAPQIGGLGKHGALAPGGGGSARGRDCR